MAGILAQIKLLGALNSRVIVSVDFSGNNLKLAHAQVVGHAVKRIGFSSKNIRGLRDEDISKAIKASLNEQGLRPTDIISMIPSHLSITKNIEIPSLDPSEIKEIINLQAGRHTPYSREEIVVDYVELGTFKRSYTKVLLVIVSRDVIKRHSAILNKAGFKLEQIIFSPESVSKFVSKMMKLENKAMPTCIVHVDEGFTDFTVVFKGKVIYVRSIPTEIESLASQILAPQNRFVDEVKSSLEAYEAEDIEQKPDGIILTGAFERVKNLESIFTSSMQKPVRTFDYLKNLPLSQEVLKSTSPGSAVSFLDVISVLFVQNELRLALVPEEVKLKRAFEEKSKEIIKTGFLALVIFVFVCIMLTSKIYFQSAYLSKLDEKYQSQLPDVQNLENSFLKVQATKAYLYKRGYSLEVLADLYSVLPENVQLTDIKFDITDIFSIKGTADSMAAVFSFVEEMEKSRYFKDVKNRYTTKRKKGDVDVADFEIISLINKEKGS
ncbi:MAG: pilus assembly protein PilM [Candidatus Omnitrophota bacterium]